MKITNKRRWASIGLGVSLLASGMSPAFGTADPTTAVTTALPAYETSYSQTDIDSVNYRTVSGTAANLTDPLVDIYCINIVTGNSYMRFQTQVPVVDGKWTSTIDLSSIADYSACRVTAVPSGFTWAGTDSQRLDALKGFTGPAIHVNTYEDYFKSMGSADARWQRDVGHYFTTSKAHGQSWGAEDGGIYRWTTYDSHDNQGPSLVNDFFYRQGGKETGPTSVDEADLTVDGVQVFSPYWMRGADMNMGNKANAAKYSVVKNTKTGAATITESSALFKCSKPETGVVYNSISYCPDDLTTKIGVSWKRVTKVSADGTVVNVVDTFASVDKKAHVVRYDQYFVTYNNASQGYRYNKTGVFGDMASAPVTNAVGYGYKHDNTAPTSFDNPIAQVVFTTVPSTTWMKNNTTMYARWNFTIPKKKSINIKAGAALITDDAQAAAQITLAGK
ncbi:MAG: hypothetical protein WCO64_04235 [Actinomycetes bacterium]